MSLKALIFDLDGTLIDSAPDLRQATNKLLLKYGRREISQEETKTFVGNGVEKLIERAFRATGEDALPKDIKDLAHEFLSFYAGHETDETRPYAGVMQTLAELKEKGFRLALCTNKPQLPSENILRDLKMEHFFEVVLGGDRLKHKKPHPEMLHWVLKEMGLNVDEAVMIGDSPNDIEGARNAGMGNIAVSYGYRKVSVEELRSDHVVDDFPSIIDVI